MPALKIERVYGPTRRIVMKGLRASIERAHSKVDHRPLAISLRHRGAIVGGLVGDTFFGWLFVSAFWVADEFRGRGFGSKMMKAAEKEARKRGVKHVYLDTFSFQASGFYRKLGYREFGRLDDFPAGHHRSWLTKAL